MQGCVRYGTYRGIPPVLPVPDTSVSSVRHKYRYRTLRYKFGTISIPVLPAPVQTFMPVPDTSVSSEHQYRYRILRGKFGTSSILVRDTLVSSVQHQYVALDTSVSSVGHQYRYRTLRQVRYDINTGTSGTGIDVYTGFVPVSVLDRHRHRTLR